MKSYYSTQISENNSIRIPMVNSLSPDTALILGALVASKNSSLATLMERRGELLLGCMIGILLEGSDLDFGSQEAVSLSKMLISDVVSLLFQAFDTLEKSLNEAGMIEQSEPEESEAEEASDEPKEDDN